MKFTTTLHPIIILIFIFFGKEFIHEIKLLAESSLNEPCTRVEEALKVRLLHNLFSFVLRKLYYLDLLVFLLLLF